MSIRRLIAAAAFGVITLGTFHVNTATSQQGYTGVYEQDFAAVIAAGEAEWMVPDGTYCDKSCADGLKCCSGGVDPY